MPINIAKFGGTSVADSQAMHHCAQVVLSNPHTRVVVVSAAGGVTNMLVSLANQPMAQSEIQRLVSQIRARQQAILHALATPDNVASKLEDLLTQLTQLALHEEILHRLDLKDELMSLGERMSSLLFTQVLVEQGVTALNFDIRKVLTTDSTYGGATPRLDEIKRNAMQLMAPELDNAIVVTQGFIGADEQGHTTTLGRGGSDYTAALLAEALAADSCEIWTDVNGVYTTDPRITDKARPLPELSFEEAAEMATFGAKVLHPASMEPALRADIPVFVGASQRPLDGGTWILRDCQHEPIYRAITRRKDQVMVTLKTPKMLYAHGFLQQVFSIIASHELSVDLVTTSEIAVSLTLDNPPNSVQARLNQKVLDELRAVCDVSVEEGLDLVTVVGNNMQSAPGISSRVFAAVSGFTLRMICYGANPHNLSFLVNGNDSTDVVKTLHRALFEDTQGNGA